MPVIKSVAVVGCGIGRLHVEGYAAHPDKFRVAAICDLSDERLADLGDRFGIERRVRDFTEVLRMDDVDVVDVCTPPALHREQILGALAAGKDVVCEKPVVGSLADVDAVIAAERTSRGRVLPIFQYRFGNGVLKARHLIDRGIAGRPYLASAETFWKRTPPITTTPGAGRWKSELGGVLITHAIHIHDLLTFLMGPVTSVFARTTTRVNAIEVEDCAVGALELQSGALASIAATLGSQEEISRLRFHFENVTFESGLSPMRPATIPGGSSRARRRCRRRSMPRSRAGRPYLALRGPVRALPRRARLRRPSAITLADARRSLELLTAFYHSAETGLPQALPIGADHPRYADWSPASRAA
jgi:predicted dehydrogenase